MLKPRKPEAARPRDDEEVDALIEPDGAHSEQDVLDLLSVLKACEVDRLAPGFISARLRRGQVARLEEIAQVGVKTAYQTKRS